MLSAGESETGIESLPVVSLSCVTSSGLLPSALDRDRRPSSPIRDRLAIFPRLRRHADARSSPAPRTPCSRRRCESGCEPWRRNGRSIIVSGRGRRTVAEPGRHRRPGLRRQPTGSTSWGRAAPASNGRSPPKPSRLLDGAEAELHAALDGIAGRAGRAQALRHRRPLPPGGGRRRRANRGRGRVRRSRSDRDCGGPRARRSSSSGPTSTGTRAEAVLWLLGELGLEDAHPDPHRRRPHRRDRLLGPGRSRHWNLRRPRRPPDPRHPAARRYRAGRPAPRAAGGPRLPDPVSADRALPPTTSRCARAPYRLEAGLQPSSETDFGNGEIDRQFFQRDRDLERYRQCTGRSLASEPRRQSSPRPTSSAPRTGPCSNGWPPGCGSEHPDVSLPGPPLRRSAGTTTPRSSTRFRKT